MSESFASLTTQPVVFASPRRNLVITTLVCAGLCLISVAFAVYALTALSSAAGCLLLIAPGFALVWGILAVRLLGAALNPPRLQIDAGGLTMSARGRRYRLLWSQVEEIRIIHFKPLPNASRVEVWLMAWPRDELPPTKGGRNLPGWNKDFGALRICSLRDFGSANLASTEAEVGGAIARFAGDLWNESSEPR